MKTADRLKIFGVLAKILQRSDEFLENFKATTTVHEDGSVNGTFRMTGELAEVFKENMPHVQKLVEAPHANAETSSAAG